MPKALALLLLVTSLSCKLTGKPGQPATAENPDTPADSSRRWTLLTDKADFPESYNFQLMSIHDSLWALHPRGTWYSVDGKKWSRAAASSPITNLAFLDYVYFNNALYGLGRLEGNIERHLWEPAIFRTNNLRSWDTLTRTSNLPRRFFYHPFVFREKIWIIGGEDETTGFADAWTSGDAVNWVRVADHLPFGKRSNSQVVELNGRLYLLNGDVWSSGDGLHWTLETKSIVPGEEIFGYAAVVFDQQIWLLGCNRNGKFKNEVLTSRDGRHWQAERAPWSPRGGMAACVHLNNIFATGGKYGGTPEKTEFVYSNDVWSLAENGVSNSPVKVPDLAQR